MPLNVYEQNICGRTDTSASEPEDRQKGGESTSWEKKKKKSKASTLRDGAFNSKPVQIL